ncbi:hypothetical protein AMECASPLE_029022 [Ameca splendens]|uniref:Uncharacterized protein n=1 Tax=Ameca splendens TaxID=208324 RepID=A0ABV0YH58_9TELE
MRPGASAAAATGWLPRPSKFFVALCLFVGCASVGQLSNEFVPFGSSSAGFFSGSSSSSSESMRFTRLRMGRSSSEESSESESESSSSDALLRFSARRLRRCLESSSEESTLLFNFRSFDDSSEFLEKLAGGMEKHPVLAACSSTAL